MSRPALHVTDLPTFATDWPDRVAGLIEAQLDQEIPSADLRTIVIALCPDQLRFGIWMDAEWESYPYPEGDEDAAGTIALDPWLDELDAIARGAEAPGTRSGWTPRRPVGFADPAREAAFTGWWGTLHDALVATAIEVATHHLATRFRQPVGVFVTVTGQEASLVGFCHPKGAPLWPVQEHRKEHGYGSAYPFASIDEDTLVIFYPEGEGDDEGPASIRVLPPEALEHARLDDDELYVRWRGEHDDVRFSSGHTREEAGGADGAEVMAALGAWAARTGRLRTADAPASQPAPADAAALKGRLEAAGLAEAPQRRALVELTKTYGLDAVAPLVADLDLAEETRGRLHRTLAMEALEAGRWALALEHIERVEGKDRWKWVETRALVGLGRWQDALQTTTDKDPAERALALGELGRPEEALALLERPKDADARAVKARLLHATDAEAATRMWRRALVDKPRQHILVAVGSTPGFEAIAHAHREAVAAIEATRAAAAAVPAQPVPWADVSAPPLPPPRTFFLAPLPGEDQEAEDLRLRFGARVGDRVWATDRSGGLWALATDQAPTKLATFDAAIDAIAASGDGVAISVAGDLHTMSLEGEVVASAPLPWRGDGPLAATRDLIVVSTNDVLHVYDLEQDRLRHRAGLAIPGGGHISGLGVLGEAELLVSSRDQLLVVDVRDTPRVIWRAETSADLLSTRPGAALINDDRICARVHWDGTALTCDLRWPLGHSPCPATVAGATEAAAWRGGAAHVVDGAIEVLGTLGVDGYPLEPRSLWLEGDVGLALTSEGLVTLSRRALLEPQFFDRTAARARQVTEWAEAQIRGCGSAPRTFRIAGFEAPLGGVVLAWSDERAQLSLHPPQSVVGLSYEDGPTLEFSTEASEGDEAPQLSGAARQQKDALHYARGAAAQDLLRTASIDVLREVGARVTGEVPSADFVLALEGERGCVVVDVVAGGGEARPRRLPSSTRPPESLATRMRRPRWYTQRAAWAARAKVDAPFFEEVLAVLRTERLTAAQRVAIDVADTHRDAVAEALLAAAEADMETVLDALCSVAERGHPGARAKLEGLVDLDPPTTALRARRALGRLDEDATLPLLRRHLESCGSDRGLPLASLAAMSSARVTQLQPELLSTYERLNHPEPLRPALARAGWTPDAATREAAQRQIAMEDDLFAGQFGGDDDEPSARAQRTWAALQIAEILETEAPLWPAGLALETRRVGWRRFFDTAWPLWLERDAVDPLLAALPGRALAAPEGPDAKLAFEVLLQALLRGHPGAPALGDALEAVPYDEGARADVFRLARLGRLSIGWSLSKAGRLAEARQVADAALADAPSDGQVRFFDARVAWLEADDPAVALPRIDAGLREASDGVGRARLENLRGAALDALGRTDEARHAFERALSINEATTDPNTGRAQDPKMSAAILSNIAEAHWKLDERDAARRAAQTAARRGATTDIVQLILSSADEEDDEG